MPAVTNRAERRAAARREKARVRKSHPWAAGPRQVGRYARTPHPCSCPSCGNQRPHVGPTLQELRAVVDVEWEPPFNYHLGWQVRSTISDVYARVLRYRPSDHPRLPTIRMINDVLSVWGWPRVPGVYVAVTQLIHDMLNHGDLHVRDVERVVFELDNRIYAPDAEEAWQAMKDSGRYVLLPWAAVDDQQEEPFYD